MRRGILPVLLFLLSAGGTLFLGSRILASERVSAERTARERLRAEAQEAAGILVAEASRAIRNSAAGPHFAQVTRDRVRFTSPAEPAPLRRFAFPEASSDGEFRFYMARAEEHEAKGGDPVRALELYRAAAGPVRSALDRAAALYRISAIHRRRGALADAVAAENDFLSAGGGSESLEELIVRSRFRPPDVRLKDDLLKRLGTGDDAVVLGLMEDAGLRDPASVERRRSEMLKMETLRPVLVTAGRRASAEGAIYGDGRLVAWVRSKNELGEGALYSLQEVPLALPAGVEAVEDAGPIGDTDRVMETVVVGSPFEGLRLASATSRAAIESAARRGAWLLGGALAALLLAGGAAFVLSVRAARREAEAARTRADFVTKVGHDLRTPLAVVRMYAETLAAGRVADPAEAREFASVAAREAERLTGMVGQVLDLARLGEGDGAPARRPLDLALLVDEVAAVHRPLLERAGMSLDLDVAAPLPVLGDSASLRGAVSNLLENAGRHATSGGSVGIEAVREGRMAVLRVLDRGPGIPAGMEESVFERFVRGPEAAGSGAGLGLALVREAAEAHDGTATASNREGGGAVFEVRLPLGEEGA